MKLSLSLGLILAAAGTLTACSSDEGASRTPTGAGGTVGAAGSPTGSAGTGTGGTGVATGGSSAGGAAGTSGTPAANLTFGPALTITADGNVVDSAGTTGINGGFYLAQSVNMKVRATTDNRDGALCFKGTTEVVPDTSSYATYYGAELGIDLKRVPVAGGAASSAAADAGADAGAPAPQLMAGSWPYGKVIGFSYKVEGQDMAAPDKGVPAARVRFKALPVGSNGQWNSYCSRRDGVIDQAVENVLFDAVTIDCWNDGNPGIGPNETTINRYPGPPPAIAETPTNPKALVSISWQISSDVVATTPAPIPFNFCITNLRPILSP